MVFRRRKTRSNEPTTSTQTKDDQQTEESLFDTIHRLANRGKFQAIVDLVLKSTAEDWNHVSSTSTTAAAASSVVDAQQVRDDDGVNKPVAAVGAFAHDHLDVALASSNSLATTPLHLILCYKPPVAIVDTMIQIIRDRFSIHSPEEFPDQKSLKTPLHIAVEHFCDVEVIERLLAGENSLLVPALLRDRLGRCPLHYNCCTVVNTQQKKKKFLDADPVAMDQYRQRKTLGILLEHYPEAASLYDVYRKTPWDYAQEKKRTHVQQLECMYDMYVIKPKAKSRVSHITSKTSSVSVTSFPSDNNDDDLPFEIRSLSCSRHDMKHMDDDVSSVGYYEAELYNTASLDDDDIIHKELGETHNKAFIRRNSDFDNIVTVDSEEYA